MMITCPSCENSQESGNFCESCGQSMLDKPHQTNETVGSNNQNEHVSTATGQQVESNPTFDKIRGQSKSFFHYAIKRFKQPNLSFTDNEQSFPNALISFFLLPLFIATFIYAIINHVYKMELSGRLFNETSLPFFNITSRLFFIFLLLLLSGYLANLVTMKITKNLISNKQLFIKYFGIQVPYLFLFSGLTLLSFLGIVAIDIYDPQNSTLILVLLVIVMMIIMILNPIIITFHQLSLQKHKQSYYFTVLSFLFNLLFTYIITKLIFESLINEFINMF